jgi:hypothetical protein
LITGIIVLMEFLETPIAEITYSDADRILHIKIKEDAEMTLANARTHYNKINSVLGNKKHLVLVDASNYYRIDKNAWEYASKKEIVANRVAVANYNSCDANKLQTQFYKASLNTLMPMELFNSKEEAIRWLKSIPLK